MEFAMTDNPIEVQEEISAAFSAYDRALMEYANGDDPFATGPVETQLAAVRTAILKHDPVVTGFDDVAGDAERLIALLRIILPTEDRMPSGTFEAIDAMQGRLQRALEVYRTAVSDGERPQD